ncbi:MULTISPECIES: hypothetical protein [Lacrimispora]|jgi:hypothetical protein|uniref:hypothetical protein n=1 Tax=Lacrimispora TaxID=2719231 RepID=UPI000BE2CDF7|nr:hypothetical protein [Lacrimispora amygdalina]MDK2964408.1 hypothetical protein [Lacrimispora sp.]
MENFNNESNQGVQNAYSVDPNKSVMSLGEWLITLIVMIIPCVNVIMMFVWGFGNGNENRKNFCRASLIMAVIQIILGVICYVVFAASFIAAMGY